MSVKSIRRTLWLVLIVVAPVPIYAVETGRVPLLWLVVVAALVTRSARIDGGPMSTLFARLLGAQAIGLMVAAYLVAWLLAKILVRAVEPERRAAVLAALVVAALLASMLAVYRVPFVAGGVATNLLGMLQVGS
jgi:hypothetical protein